MDQALFRRDEIWFVERNAANASSIYSLEDVYKRQMQHWQEQSLPGIIMTDFIQKITYKRNQHVPGLQKRWQKRACLLYTSSVGFFHAYFYT